MPTPSPIPASKAVVFLAWGDNHAKHVAECLAQSPGLAGIDAFLITDRATQVPSAPLLRVLRVDFALNGLARKAEILNFLPAGYDVFLFIDCDTRVLLDIGLGFTKALRHGIAIAPAPHYSLDHFWNFGEIMREEETPLQGQLQFNTGVIFFSRTPEVERVFGRWETLMKKHFAKFNNDQPFFTLAMEQSGFSPYCLSPSYNYRAMGDGISGPLRIWHSWDPCPADINVFKKAWPPRRAQGSVVLRPTDLTARIARLAQKARAIGCKIRRGKPAS